MWDENGGGQGPGAWDEIDDDEIDDNDEDEDGDDDSMDSMDSMDEDLGGPPMNNMGGGGPPFAMGATGTQSFGGGHSHAHPPHGLGKNVFAPQSYLSKLPANKHHWKSLGGGSTLGNTATSPAPASEQKVAAVAVPAAAKKSIPPDQLCRLRIRLPNNKLSLIHI